MIFIPFVPSVKGAPGGRQTFYGSSFAANETVSIYWGTEKGIAEGSATADPSGNISFQITFTMPSLTTTSGSVAVYVEAASHAFAASEYTYTTVQ
jgi:hypothetical protein